MTLVSSKTRCYYHHHLDISTRSTGYLLDIIHPVMGSVGSVGSLAGLGRNANKYKYFPD
ncbi:hypothetical protein [Mastigocoleus sp. MO_188.B34]|uniref:hypothetical protein n=1 Tax=Mastigocoleus sp. MO_188.B34 TaxID=3036635 RepID=UPI002623C0CF|nr:hypothetical protein [Mastigocoleus sp. MO_188.B34]